MKEQRKVAIIHNLTGGGGAVRAIKETNKFLAGHYLLKTFTPEKYNEKGKKGIQKIISYLKYIYFTLPQSYRKISSRIDNGNYAATILHHDTYTKAPVALLYLKNKSIYILHEPPREFYEPLKFHAPSIGDKVFTLLRLPIFILDKVLTRHATIVISNSKFSKSRIDKIYGVRSKLIYCGVSEKFHSLRNCKALEMCISVGSLLPYKGHDLTISAISKLENKPKLLIIGRGRKREKEKLLALAKKGGVDIEINDTVSEMKLNEMYNKSKLFINSAYREPFGLSALEALTVGAQVVTVNECGTQELKKYFQKKVIVVSRSAESLSIGIRKALSNRITRRARVPEVFKWRNTANEIRKIIES